MTNRFNADAYRTSVLGKRQTGKLQTIAGAATHSVFTITGGNVLITAMWGMTTVAMDGANTVNVQSNPTTGDTVVIVTATDLGTTDTAAGTTVGVSFDNAGAVTLVKGGVALAGWVVPVGAIESVVTGAGADGAIQWYCTWVPLDDAASLT
ncbi:MAG: hypothetical protein ACOYEV_19125, partial [Candidatus Nanopelagicales bacterium]